MCTSIRIQVSTDPYWNPGEVKVLKYDENLILKIDGIIQGLDSIHSCKTFKKKNNNNN